ncbi:MAG: Hsp20/alpha crystallin family protein [Planctomycetota bacterium]
MIPVLARRRRRDWEEPYAPMERLMERMFGPLWSEAAEGEGAAAYPVDIREEGNTLYVDAELPGFKPEEVDVNIDNGMLHITAERRAEETKGKSHLNERRYSRVERSFSLPAPVEESKVQAKLSDGVLRLELPETGESKGKRIEVK